MVDHRGEPIKTPTTPSTTPYFPLFEPSPTRSQHGGSRRQSLASDIVATPWACQSSSFSDGPPTAANQSTTTTTTTTTPATSHIPIIRPLPIRPAVERKMSSHHHHQHQHHQQHHYHQNRITKPSRHQQLQTHLPHNRSSSSPSLIRIPTPPRRGHAAAAGMPASSPNHNHHPPRHQTQPQSQSSFFSSSSSSSSSSTPSFTYHQAISHLSTHLVPLISVATGEPHPFFPRSILQYHLLTHDQLDELARYYHQVLPAVRETGQYPIQIPAWVRMTTRNKWRGAGEAGNLDVDLATKQRRWGRFLGLKGCESPVGVGAGVWEECGVQADSCVDGDGDGDGDDDDADEESRISEAMEREWRRAIERRREEEMLRAKAEGWIYRW